MLNYDKLMETLRLRRSCRAFRDEPLPEELVMKVIEAGRWSASSHNDQNTVTIWLRDAEKKARLRRECAKFFGMGPNFESFWGAPEVIAVMSRVHDVYTVPSLSYLDGSLVVGNMMLAAESLGLGSCWINSFQYSRNYDGYMAETLEREILSRGAEDGQYAGIGILALGYRADERQPPLPRKNGRVFVV